MAVIYLDNAATTLRKPEPVARAVLEALDTLGNSARGAHEGSLGAARTVFDARVTLGALLGCPRPDHVIFTANVTEALNLALCGLLDPGDHAIATDMDHNSVLRPLYRLEAERGIRLDLVPADRRGNLDYGALERLLRPDTKLVVCPHASNLTGNLTDVPRIAALAHARGALLVLDAAQTAGSRPVDMTALGADVLCFTGHKGLMGPQGTGGLCLREGVPVRPLKVGGTGVQSRRRTQPEQLPERLEAGTLNGHGIAGLAAAAAWIRDTGPAAIHARELGLTRRFYEGVRSIPGVTVYGDYSGDRAAIVALNLAGEDPGAVADALWEDHGIAVRAGLHCAPRMHDALGTGDRGAVRFSFSWFTTEEEIDTAVRALAELAR